jgi:hypothetical protein
MSFFSQVVAMRNKADQDCSEGTYYQNVTDSCLSDANKAALKSVLEKATSQRTKNGVLEASYLMKTSYILYHGDELSGLAYNDNSLYNPIIHKLKEDILLDYGPEFKVEYSDSTSKGQRLPFADVCLTLKWPEIKKDGTAVDDSLAPPRRNKTAFNAYVREMKRRWELLGQDGIL